MFPPEIFSQIENLSPAPKDLYTEMSELLNKHSRENKSNTPDFILANFLAHCLEAFEDATRRRDAWYGINPAPGANETPRIDISKKG